MPRIIRSCLALASVLLLACSSTPPTTSQRTSTGAGPAQQFSGFCQDWMAKLRERERANLSGIKLRAIGNRVVGEYTGYGSGALECSAQATGFSATPFVGTLIYEEILYAKTGKTRVRARRSTARPVRRIEVTELFRYDGKRGLP